MKKIILTLLLASLLASGALFAQTSGCGTTVNAGPDKSLCFPGGLTQLNGSISGEYLSFSWSPTTGMINPNSLQPNVNVNQTTTYTLTAQTFDPGANLIYNFDFSLGNVGFSTDYVHDSMLIYLPGHYVVVASPNLVYSNFPPCDDHSPGQGNMMLVNGSTNSNDNVWCQTVSVTPNTLYAFGAWVGTIVPISPALIGFYINGQQIGAPFSAPLEVCAWTQFYHTWNSGSATSATICIRDLNTANFGNDFALDDLFFAPLCSVADPATVTIVQPAAAAPFVQFLPCTGQATLSAAGSSTGAGFSYQWTTFDGNIVSGANTLSPVVSAMGIYTLVVTYSGGGTSCNATTSVTVVSDPTNPIAFATPLGTLDCNTPSITIQGAGSSQGNNYTYLWTTPNGNIISNPNNQNIQVNAPGTYTLTVTNTTNGCTATASAQVGFNGVLPVAAALDSLAITCAVTELSLDGTGSSSGPNISYLWTTVNGIIQSGATTLNPVVGAPGVYTLTVSNTQTGCDNSITVSVLNEQTPPQAIIQQPASLSCLETEIVLDASASGTGPGLSVFWSSPDGNFTTATDTLVVGADAVGTYILILTNTQNGCADTASVTVADISVYPGLDIAMPEWITCSVQEVGLIAQDTLSVQAVYEWSTQNGMISGPVDSLQTTVSAPGLYLLQATDTLSGCQSEALVEVFSDTEPPLVDVGVAAPFACGDQSQTLQATVATASGNFEVLWAANPGSILDGETSLQPTIGAPGIYWLTATDPGNGCQAADTLIVSSNDEAPALEIAVPGVLTCAQTEIQLDAVNSATGPAFIYQWTTPDGNILAGAQTLTPTVNAPGEYQLIITDTTNACFSAGSVSVGADTLAPVADAGSAAVLTCDSPGVSLDGAASQFDPAQTAVLWTTAAGNISGDPALLQVTALSPGWYTLQLTDLQNACSSVDSVEVMADQDFPVAAAGLAATLNCETASVFLDGSGSSAGSDIEYLWETASGNILSGTSALAPEVDQPGWYILTVTNTASGCAQTDSVLVTADFVQPLADAGVSALITCALAQVDLDGGASDQGPQYAYFWSGNILGDPAQLNVQADQPGWYVLTVTNTQNGCIASDSVEVFIDTLPPIAQAQALGLLTCVNAAVSLSATGSDVGSAIQYLWTTQTGLISGPADQSQALAEAPGEYVLTVLNTLNACSATAQASVGQDIAPPQIEAGAGQTLTCQQTLVTLAGALIAPANATFLWTTISGNISGGVNTLTPQVDAPGWYYLAAQNPANGCAAVDSVLVGQNITPPQAIVAPSGPITCQSVQLSLDASGSSQGAQITYTWTTTDGNIVSGGQSLSPLVDQAGAYSLAVFDASNGCLASAQIVVGIDTVAPQITAGPDAFFPCGSVEETLQADILNPFGTYQIQWTTAEGLILGGANSLTLSVGGAGIYHLTVVNTENGCSASDEAIVLEEYIEAVDLVLFPPLCPGDSGAILVDFAIGGTPPYTYAINSQSVFQVEPLFEDLPPGGYILFVQDALGCILEETVVLENPLPIILQLPEELLVGFGETITLKPFVNLDMDEIGSVQWTPTAGLSCADCLFPMVTVSQDAEYMVTVTDNNGCVATASVQLRVDLERGIYAPNTFSPNGDGINDRFQLFAKDGQVRLIRRMMIWSRWGESVFEVKDGLLAEGWDGTIRGKRAPAGVYTWYAEVEWADGRFTFIQGALTLIR